jgi:putative hemolysin
VGELKELMGVDALPKEEEAGYETLGGLVMTYLGRIPATGDTFSWDRFKFEVVDMDKARVDKVMLVCGPERNLEDAVRHEGE